MNRLRNIKDLADLAGVSPGTVSRALAGSELISLRTREKVQALASEHGFRPNIMARNLRIQRTGAIGVVIPLSKETGSHEMGSNEMGRNMSDPFLITMLGLLADALTENGYDLVLSRVFPNDRNWLENYVDSGRVDGLIVIGQSSQMTMLDELAARYRPLVVWGGHSEGQLHCSIGSDNRLGGDLAASHLIDRGCRRIAFIGGPDSLEVDQRLAGCRDAMRRARLEEGLSVLPADYVAQASHPDIAHLFASAPDQQQGIVAASDFIAMGALRMLSEYGLRIPGDARVIGYGGLAIGEHTVPRLSTIAQDLPRGASLLVDRLIRRIRGEDAPSVVIEPKLVVRMSS